MAENKSMTGGKGQGLSWTTILVVLNLIAFNLISMEHFSRWDFTETSRYTLSSDTIDVLRSVEDRLTVKVFISEDLPPGFDMIRRNIKDGLAEFEVAAGDKLKVIYLNPSEANPEVLTEANGYGIPRVAMASQQTDRRETMMGYLGLAILYGGRFEIIPALHLIKSLEYEMLMRIARVTRAEPIQVAFYELPVPDASTPPEVAANMRARLPRKGQRSLQSDLADVGELLMPYYDVVTTALDKPVSDQVKTLVLANTNLDDTAIYYVDQFIMRGGNVIIFLDGVRINAEEHGCFPSRGRLDEWLANYGITVNKNLVCDKHCISFPFTAEAGGQGFVRLMPYPPYIQVMSKFYNQEHPITAALSGDMYMLYVSTLNMEAPEGGQVTPLLQSSLRAWVQEGNMTIHPEKIEIPPQGDREKRMLAGMVEGSFTSYFADRPLTDEVVAALIRDQQVHRKINIADQIKQDTENPDAAIGAIKLKPQKKGQEESDPVANIPGLDELPEIDDPSGLRHPNDIILQSERAGICVIACDRFLQRISMQSMPREVQESIISGYLAARQFFANVVDFLSLGGGFSNIRAREVIPKRIDPAFKEQPSTELFMKIAGTVGSALFVIVAGLVFYFVRKSVQKKEVVL